MEYNFDELISREATNSEKFDARSEIFGSPNVIPMWVTEMDFATPTPVIKVIKKRAEHPILSYSKRSDAYFESIIGWGSHHSGWQLQHEWIDFSPGVVSGIVLLELFMSLNYWIVR